MDSSDNTHMAEDLYENTQGSGHRKALLNTAQYPLSSDLTHAFDQNSRHLGAQFQPLSSNASLSSPAHQPGSSEATTTANLRGSLRYTAPDIQEQNLSSRGWYADQVARSQRHDQDLELPNGQRPGIVVRNPSGLITTPVADDLHTLRLGEEFTKTISSKELIMQLCQGVLRLNKEWMQKLVPRPDLYEYCSNLSTWELFNAGIRTMQKVYSGELPQSFTDIFGFMHIAFAFSRVISEDGDSYYWDGFYSDLYLWHHTLSNTEDLVLFARVWDLLLPRLDAQALIRTENLFYHTSLTTPSHELFSTADVQRQSLAPESHDSSTYPSLNGLPRDALRNTLMEGMAFRGCSNFLNGRLNSKPSTTLHANRAPALEFATMAERNAGDFAYSPSHKPWTPFLKFLVDSVTLPLERCPASEPFAKHVIDTERKLQDGLIRHEHELELALISSNEVRLRTPPLG